MLATLHGGPRHGEQEWVPFSAMFNGIDSGDGGSYQFNADRGQPGGGEFRYVADQPPSDVPWAGGLIQRL
jgi:hypothetical protein